MITVNYGNFTPIVFSIYGGAEVFSFNSRQDIPKGNKIYIVIFVEINALKLCLYEYSLHVHLVDMFSAPSFGYQLLN